MVQPFGHILTVADQLRPLGRGHGPWAGGVGALGSGHL
jgi:hypothetical protein